MYIVVVRTESSQDDVKFLTFIENAYTLTDDISKAKNWSLLSKARKTVRGLAGIEAWRNYKLDIAYFTEGEEDKFLEALYSMPEVENKDYNITDEIRNFYSLLSDYSNRKVYLDNRQSELDMEQEDILHAIEMQTVNVVQGYNLYKKLHDIRVERRQVKDDIKKITQISAVFASVDFPSLISYLSMIDNQKYTPRKLTDLF